MMPHTTKKLSSHNSNIKMSLPTRIPSDQDTILCNESYVPIKHLIQVFIARQAGKKTVNTLHILCTACLVLCPLSVCLSQHYNIVTHACQSYLSNIWIIVKVQFARSINCMQCTRYVLLWNLATVFTPGKVLNYILNMKEHSIQDMLCIAALTWDWLTWPDIQKVFANFCSDAQSDPWHSQYCPRVVEGVTVPVKPWPEEPELKTEIDTSACILQPRPLWSTSPSNEDDSIQSLGIVTNITAWVSSKIEQVQVRFGTDVCADSSELYQTKKKRIYWQSSTAWLATCIHSRRLDCGIQRRNTIIHISKLQHPPIPCCRNRYTCMHIVTPYAASTFANQFRQIKTVLRIGQTSCTMWLVQEISLTCMHQNCNSDDCNDL